MNYKLPDEPVDQMEIVVYRIDDERIKKIRYIYHINTPWKAYAPIGRTNGADLVDDWMVYIGDSDNAEGRCCGWLNLLRYLQRDVVFATAEAATLALIPILEERAAYYRGEAARIDHLLTEMKERR